MRARAGLAHGAGRSDELSLEERFGLLGLVRIGLALVVLIAASAAPSVVGASPARVALPCAALTALAVPVAVASRGGRRWTVRVQRLALAADAAFLVVVTAASGGPRSPLLVLFALHLVAVATLGSGAAALQVAMWDAAGTIVAATTSLGARIATDLGASPPPRPGGAVLAVSCAGFLAVAGLTAGFARVNERELRRSRGELEALAAMAADLDRRSDPDEVASAFLVATAAALRAPRAALLVPGGPHLVVDGRAGGAPVRIPGDDTGGAVVDHARRVGTPVARRVLDPAADPEAARLLPGAGPVLVAALGPGTSQPVLVLELAARNGAIARRTLLVAGQFAAHGAVALASASLLAERERLAAVDGLTGLANRRALDSGLAREVASAARRQEPLALVLVDIDHFKTVNDTRGHMGGDEVLRAVASVLQTACRAQDLVARYGGEEFALVLPSCPAAAAEAIVERARVAMGVVDVLGGVTVSAGVATIPDHAADGAALLKAADAALYAAKAAGRNRVCVASTPAHA